MTHSPEAQTTSEVIEQICHNQMFCFHSDAFYDMDPKLSSI